ncbi:MAG: HlyD family efflux transporter periplasmic adaptor subunit [[Clostridium] scindens]
MGAKTRVYTLSDKKLEFADATSESQELTSEEQSSILMKTQSFCESFKEQQFSDVYTLKNSVSNILESKSSQSRQSQLDGMVTEGMEGLQIYSAASDGVIVYSTDGYENTTISDVTEDMIAKKDYQATGLKNNSRVKAGSPVYKLIKDNNWTAVILLDDAAAQEMADMKSVKIRFSKDNETAVAGFSIYNTKDANLGFLTFDNSHDPLCGRKISGYGADTGR